MADVNLSKVPGKFPDANVTHLQRVAEVIFIKRVRSYILPASGEEREINVFRREYAEFLKSRKLLQENKTLNEKWRDPDVEITSSPLYYHFQISASSQPTAGSQGSINDLVAAETNADVLSISVSNTTQGRSQCVIRLNNRANKYEFLNNPLRRGETVFSSDDQVYVNLPGLDGNLYRAFTGFITTISNETVVGNTLQSTITLQCDDMLKRLVESRTNVKPSTNLAESEGTKITGLNPNFGNMLPHEIFATVMCRAYADFFTVEGYYDAASAYREAAVTASPSLRGELAVSEEENVTKPLCSLPASPDSEISYSAQVTVTNALITGVNTRVEGSPFLALSASTRSQSAPGVGGQGTTSQSKKLKIPSRIFGFRRAQPTSNTVLSVAGQLAKSSLKINADVDDIAFVIDGTDQPVFRLACAANISAFQSEWESSLALLDSIARDINFEIFADANGIVRVRPINGLLPYDFVGKKQGPVPTSRLNKDSSQVGSEYWIDPKYIQYQNYTQTDGDIFTIAYVIGALITGTEIGEVALGVAVDYFKFNKLGARVAPTITKLNLQSSDACAAHAEAYLSRLNGKANTATISYVGDARLKAGNPCWIKSRNEIYYIESVTHEFTAGQSYTTTLNLTYGRRPFCVASPSSNLSEGITDADTLTIINKNIFPEAIARLVSASNAENALVKAVNSGTTYSDYIVKNADDLRFNNCIWPPIFTLEYSELKSILNKERQVGALKEGVEEANLSTRSFSNALQTSKIRLPGANADSVLIGALRKFWSSRGVA